MKNIGMIQGRLMELAEASSWASTPFMTFIMENGDELLMVPENGAALSNFRENEGKKIRATYRKGRIFLDDDVKDGSGECVRACYFEYGIALGGNSPEAAGN